MFLRTAILLGRFKRFRQDNRGHAAVEFAIVALPFFTLLMASIDFGMMLFANSVMDNAVTQAARQIRTGQVTSGNVTAAQFRQMVCNNLTVMMACDEKLGIDVRVFNSFANVSFPAAVDNNGNLIGAFQYQPGGPGDIVLVRAFYAWPMLTPVLSSSMSNMNGGARLLSSSSAFRNEPFGELLN